MIDDLDVYIKEYKPLNLVYEQQARQIS